MPKKTKKPTELEALNNAIRETNYNIARTEDQLANLRAKRTNQLAEYHRQSTKLSP